MSLYDDTVHCTENTRLREGLAASVPCAWLRVGMQEMVAIVIFMTVVARGHEMASTSSSESGRRSSLG